MKVVIAPDSFKESLSAVKVAAALAEGVLQADPDANIDLCPMADGGEGTVEAMVAATGGELISADVFGPLGGPIRARFGLLGGEKTAVIEMAAASGLVLVPHEHRDPMRTTTFGTGQLILAALDAGASEILMGIGGSATVDGGCGCAQALGVVFTGCDGRPCVCGLSGGGLKDVRGIDTSSRDPRVAATRIRVACDVTNPLTGPEGAAAVYGPQKGATPEMVAELEAGLKHIAEVIRRELNADVLSLDGAGAAGGLGAGLVAFAGATLENGAEIIAEAVGLSRRLNDADLCITGEGRLDKSSRFGKTPVAVAAAAARASVPVVCIPGQVAADAPTELFAAVRPLVADEVTERLAIQQPQAFLKQRAAEVMRDLLDAR